MGKRSAFDRREGDFATKHIFAASNLPVALTELRIEALVPRRATPIVLCDAGDGLAPAAAAVMERMGYRALSILDGGIAAWARAGHRLFSGINVPSKAFGEYVERQAGTPHIDPREVERLMQRGEDLIVLDSRPFAEYRFMSIPGAIDCPGGELVYRFFENVPSPGTLVVVNCAGRTRSIIGAQSLIDAGVLNRVVALRDGTMGWRLAGLSLEHGAARRAPAPAAAALAQAQARARAVALRAGVRGASWDEYRAIRADATRTSYLFDVRDPEEFVRAHPEGAVSAPGGQLVQTLDTFAAVRNARIFICDADDVRGAMTAAWLRQIGWADVFHIAGGLAGATLAAASETPVPASAPAIAPVAAAALVAQARALVLDLANSKDYRRRHIGGALFCERAELPQLLAAHAGRTALVTSPGGRLAAIATAALPGNADVRALAGGTDAWEAAGFPVESGRGNLPERPTDVFYRPYDSDREVEAAMRQYLDWEVDLLGQIEGEPGVHFQRL